MTLGENTQQPLGLFKNVDPNIMDLKPLRNTVVLFVVVFHLFNMVQPFESYYQGRKNLLLELQSFMLFLNSSVTL